jgi:hypothetical protein
MALITDPDNLNQGVEVDFNTTLKTITLNQAGNLSTDGVTLQAVYSFCKEEWKADASLIPVEFPFVPITDESFELVEGWDFANDASRYLIRTGGWTVKNTSNQVTQKWAGIIGLGTIEANDQLYFNQGQGAVNVQLLGQVNQAVQIIDDPNGDGVYTDGFDRTNEFTLFVREQSQLYDSSNLTGIGVSALDSQAYRFPISTGGDAKITASDATIDTTAPYTDATNQFTATDISFTSNNTITTAGAVDFSGLVAGDTIIVTGSASNDGTYEVSTANATTITVASTDIATESAGASITVAESLMSIKYYASPQAITISGTSYNFGVVIDAAGGTAEEVYEFVQRQLRRNIDINAEATGGDVIGKTADELLVFVGDDLKIAQAVTGIASVNPEGGGTGIYITNFQAGDTNRLFFVDNTGATVQFDFVAVTTLSFNPNLTGDADAIYRVFFTTNPAGNYGTSNAVIVHANDNVQSTDISFDSAADTITTAGAVDFGIFATGDYIEIENSTSNDGFYKVSSVTTVTNPNDTITVDTTFAGIPANESAGATVDVTQAAMGDISGNATIQFDFNYDNNVQGGRTSNTNAPITVVAIGLETGQFVSATTTIERTVTNSASLVAPLERNYENA